MKTINIKVRELNSLLEKTIGLIGKKNPEPILLKTRFGIHTFGLKFPIDVLILDDKNKIINLKNNLKPNRIFIWNPKYKNVLELPNGFIKKNNLKTSDRVFIDIRNN